MPFQTARATNGVGPQPLQLYAMPLQFDFYRVEEDLGWHHGKIGPEDDRSARSD
jgi:hypothetical protein